MKKFKPMTSKEILISFTISILVMTLVLLLNQKHKNGMDRSNKIINCNTYNGSDL